METIAAITQFLTVLEANHYAALVLIALALIGRRGPPKR